MLYIPQGKTEYQRLPTVFLNWNEMSTKLRGDEFSGYVEVDEAECFGYILFIKGKISGSLYISDKKDYIRGQPSLSKTMQSIHGKKGNLSIYACDEDVCDLIMWFINGNHLYTPMESSFIDWNKFLSVMKDRKITGFIRVESPDYTEFIKLDSGDVKGHFIGGNSGFEDKSPKLTSILENKDTHIEVLKKSDTPADVKPLPETPVIKSAEPEKKPTPVPVPQPTDKKEPEKADKPDKPASPSDPTQPVDKKKPLISPDEIPDPFASDGEAKQVPLSEINLGDSKPDSEPSKPESKIDPFRSKPEPFYKAPEKPVSRSLADYKKTPEKKDKEEKKENKPITPPPSDKSAGKTMVSKPTGRVAFLIDGIRKVAQSNIGDDILPWLDGQISRVQSVNPKLTKQDLTLLVDEIERYVRQVRQNPTKAEKLANQLRHIIDSFASDL